MKIRAIHLLIILFIAACTAAHAQVSLISTNAPVRAFVPSDPSLGLSWTQPNFDDTSWTAGSTGVGYDTTQTPVNYLPLIGLNLLNQMQGINQSACIRVPFGVGNPAEYDSLTLRVKYDDGFVAWLNGIEIARDNALGPPVYNSGAQANRLDADAVVYRDFDVTQFLGALIAGQNVIAFQLLNNGVNSSDALLLPVLEATTAGSAFTLSIPTGGSGTVSKNPDQISYASNTVVMLTATANAGWAFSGWSGDASGSDNPLTVTMTNSKAITANFTNVPTTLGIGWSTLDGGGGTSTGVVFAVRGTIGQHDAGKLSAGNTILNGGFWGVVAVQTPGAPTLTIAAAAPGQATVSWTPDTPGFVLQETLSLSPTNWMNSVSGATNPIVIPAPLPTKFYRLFKL